MAHDTRGIACARAMAEMGLQCSMQVAECGGGHRRSRHHMGCAESVSSFLGRTRQNSWCGLRARAERYSSRKNKWKDRLTCAERSDVS